MVRSPKLIRIINYPCYPRALCAPGWIRKWHAAVRVTKSRKMVGFISAVPIKMKVYDK